MKKGGLPLSKTNSKRAVFSFNLSVCLIAAISHQISKILNLDNEIKWKRVTKNIIITKTVNNKSVTYLNPSR